MNTHQFSRKYEENYSKFIRFAHNLTHSHASAQDLVQEAGIKAFRNIDSLKSGTKFRPWFYRVIYNTFISAYKKKKRRRELLKETGPNRSLFYNKFKVENKGEERLRYADIHEILENLKEKYRDCFEMYFNGYSYKEIADYCNVPVGTVKSRINTARRKMIRDIERLAA